MEIEREVRTFQVEKVCDTCKQGRMIPGPFTESLAIWRNSDYSGEPNFVHVCNNIECKATETYPDRYPKLIIRYIDS